jgi:hypothetical protein
LWRIMSLTPTIAVDNTQIFYWELARTINISFTPALVLFEFIARGSRRHMRQVWTKS